MEDWRPMHGQVMKNFILYLNRSFARSRGKFILKGGTSLMFCYGLTRFSEDIDLDALDTKSGIEPVVRNFTKECGFTYRVAKDTQTVKRYMIHYGGKKPLKIEISYRRARIAQDEYCVINGILVYNIQSLLAFKINAYNGRDKIRDLFDVVFICKNYWNCMNSILQFQVMDALSYKGLEHFDYIIKTQKDDLIDNNVLANEFLDLYFKLGLN